MGCRGSLLGRETYNERAIQACGLGRRQVPRDDNRWLLWRRRHITNAMQRSSDLLDDILYVSGTRLKHRIARGSQHLGIGRHRFLHGSIRGPALPNQAGATVNERWIVEHERLGFENAGLGGGPGGLERSGLGR